MLVPSLHSCLTLCDPRTVSHQAPLSMGILQARILEWAALLSSRGSSWPRDRSCISCVSALPADSLPLSHWIHGMPVCLGKIWQPHAIVLCSYSSPTYWTDQGSRAMLVPHSLTYVYVFSSCHWPVVVFQKQSMVKFKVIDQGSWWSKST